MEIKLYAAKEVDDALNKLRKQAKYTKLLKAADEPPQESTPEGLAYQQSKQELQFPIGKSPPEYEELSGVSYPGELDLSAQQMSKLIAFLKMNGNFKQQPTQALGNCLYAAVLRGIAAPFEFTTQHLRRFIVMKMMEHSEFFFNYLRYPLALYYGLDRDYTPKQIDERERKGLMTAKEAHDARLPGPFSFVSFLSHINTSGTWGDTFVLNILSCIWQMSITSLNCEELKETRYRHSVKLNDVDLVVLFVGGDHFMGAGE